MESVSRHVVVFTFIPQLFMLDYFFDIDWEAGGGGGGGGGQMAGIKFKK